MKKKEKIIFIPSKGTNTNPTDGCDVHDYMYFYKKAKEVNADCFDTDFIVFPLWVRVISYCNLCLRRVKLAIMIVGFIPAIIVKSMIASIRVKRKI